MSDSTGPATGETEGGAAPQGSTAPEGSTPPEGAAPPEPDPTDWKAEARKWEARSKENKSALESLTGKFSDLESKNGELVEKVNGFESKTERDALLGKVSAATGVPADALRGADEAELTAHAESLKALMPSAPVIEGQGKTPGTTPGDPNIEAVQKLFGKN